MKVVVYLMLYFRSFACFIHSIEGQRTLTRSERDLISWNRMGNNAFALKKRLHPSKNDQANILAQIIQFCFRAKKCTKRIE